MTVQYIQIEHTNKNDQKKQKTVKGRRQKVYGDIIIYKILQSISVECVFETQMAVLQDFFELIFILVLTLLNKVLLLPFEVFCKQEYSRDNKSSCYLNLENAPQMPGMHTPNARCYMTFDYTISVIYKQNIFEDYFKLSLLFLKSDEFLSNLLKKNVELKKSLNQGVIFSLIFSIMAKKYD